jgi:hypothetical protein
MWRPIAILFFLFIWPIMSFADVVVTNSQTPLELITDIRKIVDAEQDFQSAIDSLNALLLMPPNDFTEEAQELIGLVYEKSGKLERAKLEYAAYLTIYPTGKSVTKIRQRLIALEIATPPTVVNRLQPKVPRVGKEYTFSGSVSEYLYSTSSSPTAIGWGNAQYSLISNLNLSPIIKYDEYQAKAVLRYTNFKSLSSPDADKSKIISAFVDIEDTHRGYGIKIGRQYPVYGAIGRFDGVLARFNSDSRYEIIAQAGQPYTGTVGSKRFFYGAGVNARLDSALAYSIYYNKQSADNVPERSAIGLEARYFKNNISLMSIIEYDFIYKTANSTMFQGTLGFDSFSVYILADKRKAPVLFADRALELGMNSINRIPYATVSELVTTSGLQLSEVYRYINESTPTSVVYVLGINKKITKTWDISTDIQMTNISPVNITPIPIFDIPTVTLNQPGTGNAYSVNLHLFGTDVFEKKNTVDILLSKTADKISTSSAITLATGKTIDKFHSDIIIRKYVRSQSTMNMSIDTVSARISYKINEKASFESQFSVDHNAIHNKQLQTMSKTYNKTFFAGIRYDF